MALSSRVFATAIPLLILFGGCKKEPSLVEQLPAESADGREMFACIVNNSYVSSVSGTYEPPGFGPNFFCDAGVASYNSPSAVWLEAYECREDAEMRFSIEMNVDSVEPGRYELGGYPKHQLRVEVRPSNGNVSSHYFSDSLNTGQIVFTRADDVVYAGTFSCSLRSLAGATMTLTQGRFDIKR